MDIPLFAHGQWATTPDPCPEDLSRSGMEEAGFDEFATFGSDMFGYVGSPLMLEVYRRPTEPRFVLFVGTNSSVETTAAATGPDLMQLLAQWLPAVQAATVVALLQGLNFEPEALADDLVAIIRNVRNAT